MIKLNKTQTNCIHKAILFEVAKKEILQKKIDAYKCLRGFKVTYATKKKVILMKPINASKFHKVVVDVESIGWNNK